MADPLAMARLLMGGQPQTAGTAFEPVTWQQQLQNYKGLEGQENAWRTAEGSPWKPAEPGPVAKAIGNALTSQTGQRFMDLANFLGPGPKMMPRPTMSPSGKGGGSNIIRGYHGSPATDIVDFRGPGRSPKPVFAAVDDGTPRPREYAGSYAGDKGKVYDLDIDASAFLDARTPEGRAALVAALDKEYPLGGEAYLMEKGIAEGKLPGWGDDMLFRAAQGAGHKGMYLNERPDVVSAAVFDPTQIKQRAPEGPKGIRAYHGSPHDFDRFDLSKIGSGEGAQAFGHGLYFAEAEAVAKQYRDMLGNYADSVKWKGPQPPNELQQSILKQLSGPDSRGQMMTIDKLKREAAQLKREVADWDDEGNMIPGRGPNAAEYARQTALIEELERSAGLIDVKPPGRMYEVNIKASPDQFLDYDGPLSPKVQEILNPITGKLAAHEGVGRALEYAKKYMRMAGDDRMPEQLLREAGIPGIRYKDQGSRGAEGGTSNYVVFDDKLIEIVKKYGLAALLMGGATGGGSSSGNAAP
jgi:hypothetical protein